MVPKAKERRERRGYRPGTECCFRRKGKERQEGQVRREESEGAKIVSCVVVEIRSTPATASESFWNPVAERRELLKRMGEKVVMSAVTVAAVTEVKREKRMKKARSCI